MFRVCLYDCLRGKMKYDLIRMVITCNVIERFSKLRFPLNVGEKLRQTFTSLRNLIILPFI